MSLLVVGDAVRAASRFVQELYPRAANKRLEAVELAGDDTWRVTISFVGDSFLEPEQPVGPAASLAQALQGRLYKVVSIDSRSGEPKALQMTGSV